MGGWYVVAAGEDVHLSSEMLGYLLVMTMCVLPSIKVLGGVVIPNPF